MKVLTLIELLKGCNKDFEVFLYDENDNSLIATKDDRDIVDNTLTDCVHININTVTDRQ